MASRGEVGLAAERASRVIAAHAVHTETIARTALNRGPSPVRIRTRRPANSTLVREGTPLVLTDTSAQMRAST